MMYVYAITDRPDAPLPRQLGLRDEELTQVVWRDLVAVVSPFDGAALSKSADELWRHEEVVEALMGDRAVLPMRFATLLPSPQHVGDTLCRSYRAFVEDIARVRGQVEIGMRFMNSIETGSTDACPFILSDKGAPSGAGPGAVYMRAKLAEEQNRESRRQARLRPVREIYDRLASHANAGRLDEKPDDRHGTSAAFLVPRDGMTLFRGIVDEQARAHPELALLCTGPWPPYSFVNAAAGSASQSDERHAR